MKREQLWHGLTTFCTAALCAAVLTACTAPTDQEQQPTAGAMPVKPGETNMITIKTSLGEMQAELYADKAPETVKNFLQYVKDGHYNGTIFHRVIANFMIQGGGFTRDMEQKPTRGPVRNEAANGLKNTKGTLAMARTSDVDSATSQFFINVADNGFLDFRSATTQGFGYCVFGKVTKGLDVLEKIKAVPTGNFGPHGDVPTTPVDIISITVQ
jgi:cyclophilin family peptidyl-prolyl cis-trans isomerase